MCGVVSVIGTCVLAIASLRDVGDIPSKPDISAGGTEGVIATWRSVSEYVQLLSERCLSRLSFLGWTAYRKLLAESFAFLLGFLRTSLIEV